MKKTGLVWLVLGMMWLAGCSDGGKSSDGNTDTSGDSDTVSDSQTQVDTDGATDDGTDSTSDSDSATDSASDTASDSDSDTTESTDTQSDDDSDTGTVTDPTELPLLTETSLTLLGAFRVPDLSQNDGDGKTFAWTEGAMAINPQTQTLFLAGHDYVKLVAEISIPPLVSSATIEGLAMAQLVQPFADITEGHMTEALDGITELTNVRLGGLMVAEQQLIGAVYLYYEQADQAVRSHFTSSLDLSLAGDFQGLFTIGALNPGMTAAYMGSIPPAWQSVFGATAITGNACIPIIGRSSFGPSLSTFSPSQLSANGPSPSSPLVYYTEEHPTLGTYVNEEVANPRFNMATRVSGTVFPHDTRTVLFFGKTGLGIPEYGAGTADINLDGQPVPDFPEEFYVYDPANPLSKGGHAWPYTTYVWAYDALDLLAVKNGQKQPWEVEPYATWSLPVPFADPDTSEFAVGNAAYDSSNGRMYLPLLNTDSDNPLILVFSVTP